MIGHERRNKKGILTKNLKVDVIEGAIVVVIAW
jgi:hypothetical protein